MRAERLLAICRDVICLLLGAGGIAHQILVGPVSEILLLVCTGLIGAPVVPALRSLRQGDQGGTGTTGSSSQSPDPGPSPVSRSRPSVGS